ncbi:hypothetical protein KJ068_06995 [bacterium]|nr:hypothetical protein [bacterium]
MAVRAHKSQFTARMASTIKKRIPFGPLFQGLIADPKAKHYQRMKQAVWLYLYFIAFSNLKTGKLTAQLSDIAHDMGLPEETLRSWLGHLRKWHYVMAEKQGDEVLFKITKWKNIATELEATVSPQQEKLKKNTGRRIEPIQTASGEERKVHDVSGLAHEIASALEEPDNQPYFEELCRRYSDHIIQKSLEEARAVPTEKIKKSRGALFAYLVKKYAREEQSSTGH